MIDMQLPLDSGWGYLNGEFGPRQSIKKPNGGWTKNWHNGADFAVRGGTPIYAIADGDVVESKYNGDWGEWIAIRHNNPAPGPRLGSGYGHMQPNSRRFKVGDKVRKGQVIGLVGTTGASTGNHLHWETYEDGAPIDPRTFQKKHQAIAIPASLSSTQRRVGAVEATRRVGKASVTASTGEPINAGDVGNFKGWVYGDTVEGNNVWYVGTSGDFFWSGGFVGGANTNGLTDLNPAQTMGPNQRRTKTDLNGRSAPDTDAPVVQTLPVNTIADFDGWRHGDSVDGETRWVRGAYSQNWFTLKYLDPQSVAGLPDLNTSATIPVPSPNEKTEAELTPKLVTPGPEHFPSWIKFDVVLDPDGQKPDTNQSSYKYYGQPYNPIESHVHWWGEPGKAGTHDGNVNHLKTTVDLSANFVTSAGRVTLMVPINKVASTTGKRNPYGWKSENDPALTELGYLTLGYLHYIVEKLNPSLLNEPVRRHNEFMNTGCSQIDTARVRSIAEQFRTGALDPKTGKAPVIVPPKPQPEPEPKPTPIPEPGEAMVTVPLRFLRSLPSEFRSLADEIEALLPKGGTS